MRALGVSTILSTLVLPMTAYAAEPQEAPAPAADQAEDQSGGLGEIIVTATRDATSIQKVPISMQALSTEVLAQRQIRGLTDFAAMLPSVTFAGIGPGRNTPFFRGIVPAGGARESVGYYIDDIPITGTALPDIYVYDVERIEALSGPQGTLYGAGSLAGTIRFISNKPKLDTFEFGWDAEVNKYGEGDFGGNYQTFINAPISSTLAVRAMAFYRKDGGYIDNLPNNGKFADGSPALLTLGDNNPNTKFLLDNGDIAQDDYNTIEQYGGRLQVLWEPADGWSIMPQITAQKQIAAGYFGFDPDVGDLAVHDYDITEQNDQFYQAALTINGHIGDWDIVSATGYYQREVRLRNDYTYYTVTYDKFGAGYENYLQFFDQNGCTGAGAALKCTSLINPTQFFRNLNKQKKFTQELRISTPKSWPFDVTLGGFYHRQNNEANNDYSIHGLDKIVGYTRSGGGDTNPAGFGVPTTAGGTMILGTPAVQRDAFYMTQNNNNWSDYAIFAEGHYNITPELKLTGGIRYFWTEFDIVGFAGVAGSARNAVTSTFVPTGARGCPVPLPAGTRLTCLNTNFAVADQTGRYKEEGQTHKVALNWQFDPSKMLYANYSTGFRPGGFNRPLRIRNIGIATVPPFQSETLTNYELGFKGTWNNMFRFNAAVYMEDWNNIQYSVVVSGAQGAGMTGNAGKARVYGVEFDADLKLGEFTFSTSGAYNDAKLKGDFCNFAFDPASLSIAQLPTCAAGQTVAGSSPPTPQVAAADGTRLPRQPKFKGTSSIRYDTQMGDMDAYVQGAALYQTSATQDLNVFNNNLYGNTAGFVSFDFSAGIKKKNWTLDVFLQNAFDKRGELTRNTFCSITFCSESARTFTIRPQFFGMRWGQRY
ncbi:TonB-dependent receptor [Novosphingobium sp. AAP83]|uniref:TonB-dependent receptor n=1 Tax=Novosphingobium sp. AAP83 TaxID=1523425 RepID=UPI0006B8AA67|nr:TonB-dependent receptor [Novosphingobium sp. AAP83]